MHIIDEVLNLYILNPSLLEDYIRNETENHLQFCDECKNFVNEIKDFYNELYYLAAQDFNTIHILSSLENSKSVIENLNYSKLVAQQEKAKYEAIEYIGSFISGNKVVLIRLLKNNILNKFLLYLLSDDNLNVEYSLITITETGKSYIADKEGIIKLNEINFNSSTFIKVQLPISYFSVPVDLFVKSGSCVLISEINTDHLLNLEFNNNFINYKFSGITNFTKVVFKFWGEPDNFLIIEKTEGEISILNKIEIVIIF